jgi:hypothetical protein
MTALYRKQTDDRNRLQACGLWNSKKCPDYVSPKEPPIAEELRAIMSGNVFINDNREGYTFINKLTTYPVDPCMTCEAYMGGYFHLVALEDLMKNTDWLMVNDQYLYPMLVWAMKNDKPVLAYVSPGQKKPVRVIKKFSSDCMAYMICAAKQED